MKTKSKKFLALTMTFVMLFGFLVGFPGTSLQLPVFAADYYCDGSTHWPTTCACPGICCDYEPYCHCNPIGPCDGRHNSNTNQTTDSIEDNSKNTIVVKEPQKAIIIVPGIAGSELYLGNELFWPPSDGTAVKNTLIPGEQKFERELMFNDDGTPRNLNVRADNPSIESFGALGTYTNLYKDLFNTYGKDYKIEFFAYDWRKTNSDSADLLYEKIKDYTEVIIVAHSMGGIVSSLCIAEHGTISNGTTKIGNVKLDKLITLGTPYLGAPKAFYVFETGRFMDTLKAQMFSNAWLKNLAKNIPGIYELLPNERYFKNGNYYLERVISEQIVIKRQSCNFSETESIMQSRQAVWFKQPIYDTAKSIYSSLNNVYDKIISNDINSYIIVGYNNKTISCLSFAPHTGYVNTLDVNWLGDGTVPLISSTFHDIEYNGKFISTNKANMGRNPYYVNGVNHTELVKDKRCIQLIKNIIDEYGDTNKNNRYSYDYNCGGIVSHDATMRIKGTFDGYKITAACPVTLSIYDTSNNWLGTVSSDNIDYAEEHNYDFYVAGQDNEIKIAFIDNDCDIVLTGLDDGVMEFTIEKYADGEVVDTVNYSNVSITKNTIIRTNTDSSENSKLNVAVGTETSIIYPDGRTVESEALKLILTIGKKEYFINGTSYVSDVAPFIANDRTLVPLRLIAEAMGADVSWDDVSRMVTIQRDSKIFTLVVDVPLPNNMGTPVIINGRTLVPVRYISEQLGAKVEWDASVQSVSIDIP